MKLIHAIFAIALLTFAGSAYANNYRLYDDYSNEITLRGNLLKIKNDAHGGVTRCTFNENITGKESDGTTYRGANYLCGGKMWATFTTNQERHTVEVSVFLYKDTLYTKELPLAALELID
ncbi:hypothetical protein 2050HW_00201 [Serratia phage vB_SmaM_ 2050HW]|uniref:Uncharacterized protein n=2 Tax=Moabitevirus TaxID=2843422 RepID=A0A7T3NBX1_9CAUD|nr:hypothetical protein HWB23_gp201 [Serratia phage vB_SmaM_ 2050HW]ATA65536.1 hypothetical protein 2050HW_00201 [Serratia phage vB_SmaM_ 2050HW]QPX76883.1 hypothetical protein [Serratia phage vB_SmaM_Yaphecito]UCR74792.1 hypothetical protein [Serratia phage BUCT660]URG14054.1 hypothetical protein [Pectobacterium phage vB_ParM-25]